MNSLTSLSKIFLIIASFSACTAVALGAFAAHILKDKLSPDLFAIFDVGVRYHMYHALALFAVAWCVTQFPTSSVSVSGWLFIVGTVVFSGSLYVLSITGMRWLGAITPVGGICFLAGWIWLARCVWKEL